jgi:hypothetical protein
MSTDVLVEHLLALSIFLASAIVPPSESSAVDATPTPARARSVLAFESDPVDYLGRGQTKVLTDAQGHFIATHEPGLVLVDFEGSESYWSLAFQAPRGQELTPGIYEGATSGFAVRKPGLDIRGEHRACGFSTGRFVVREGEYSANGDVERFAADFELYCDNRDFAFIGYVRIDSAVPEPLRTPRPPPPDHFVLQMDSEPGDWVGGGRKRTLTALDGLVRADHFFYPSIDLRPHVNLQLNGDEQQWSLILASPRCADLVPGAYEGATAFPWEAPLAPGIEVMFNRRWCEGRSEGRFVIHDVHYGPYHEIYRFVADFEQRCTNAPGALRGSVSFTSLRPTPTPAPPTPTPADYSSLAALNSELGDFIGHCTQQLLTLADGDFSAFYEEGGVTIVFTGESVIWTFSFAAPLGKELAPGTYWGARHFGLRFIDPDRPGMRVFGEGRGCQDVRGLFTVHEAELGTDGEVLRFAADFEQHCEGDQPALYGTVRFRSSLPPPSAPPGKPPTVPPPRGPCWGDCSEDGEVTLNEVVLGINIALDRDAAACSRMDLNDDGGVTIDELLAAIKASIFGCDANLPAESDGA